MLAQLLHLPSEAYLSEFLEVVDPDAVWKAHTQLKAEIGRALWDSLIEVYDAMRDGTPGFERDSIGARSLKNACLNYLCGTGADRALQLAVDQFEASGNMTDTMAALNALNHTAGPERDRSRRAPGCPGGRSGRRSRLCLLQQHRSRHPAAEHQLRRHASGLPHAGGSLPG